MSTTGNTIKILAADIPDLQTLLLGGPIFAQFQDGTYQQIKISSAQVVSGVGVVTGIVGANPDGTFWPPLDHAAGTVVSCDFSVRAGDYYSVSPPVLNTPLTPRKPIFVTQALFFLDSTQHWTTPDGSVDVVGRKWTSDNGSIATVTAPWGESIQIDGGVGIAIILPQAAVFTAGCRYTTQGLSNAIIAFINAQGSLSSYLVHDGSGGLKVTLNASSDTSIPAFTMSTNTEYYIEMQSILSGALTNDYRVRIWDDAGVKLVDHSGSITVSGATWNKWNAFGLGGPGGGSIAKTADIYCTNSKFLGDSEITYLKVAGVGSTTEGSVSTGPGPQWFNNSDGQVPDDNTTTTEYAAQNDYDLYTLDQIADPGGGKEPVAFQFIALQEHPGTSISTGMFAMKSGVKSVFNTPIYSCAYQYNYGRWPGLKNPATNLMFTWAEVNALETGPMRNA